MKKAIGLVIFFLSIVIMNLFALSVSAFQNCSYNYNKNYSLTGNYAIDIVAVANAQVGKTQSDLKYTEAWCADFVMDCARLTGMPDSIIPYNYSEGAYVPNLYNYLVNNCGASVVSNRQAGDILFYYCSKCGGYKHVSIVIDGTYSVEGNYYMNNVSQVVKAKSYWDDCGHSTNDYISRVYVRPKYNNKLGTPVDLGSDFYAYIINRSAWKHLTYDEDWNITIRTETGASNQIWHFQRLDNNGYKITSVKDGRCMEVHNFGTSSGTNVHMNDYNGNSAQIWYIYGTGGEHKLKAKCTDCVLDVNGGSSEDGTNVQTWEYNNSNAQNFSIWKLELPKISKPKLNVSINNRNFNNNVSFNWEAVSNAHIYDIRIKQNGETIDTIWSVSGTAYSTNLAPGNYTANLAAVNKNFMNYSFSDEISFTVEWAAPEKAIISMEKISFGLNERIKFDLDYDRSKSVSIVILKNGEKIDSSGEIAGQTTYYYTPSGEGKYEAYLSVWNPAGYKDSERVSFTVYSNDKLELPLLSNVNTDTQIQELNLKNISTVNIENKSLDFAAKADIIFVYKNELGEIIDINKRNINVPAASSLEVSDINKIEISGVNKYSLTDKVEVYLWDSIRSMIPLSEKVEGYFHYE